MVTTGAILVLLGWELNIIESTIALLTVGLSFDFVLHYALAFCKSCELKRTDRAVRSINEVICPVTMSMLTTFVTGLGMVFADTLCFLQIGSFMMLIAILSWLISTLFFTSMLACFGPEMSRLPNEIISGSRRTSKISRNDENLYDKCLLSTSSFEQCSSRFPVLEQYDGRLLRCSRTGIHSKRSSGQLYYGDIRRASMPVAFTAFVNRRPFTGSLEDRRRNSSIDDESRQHITKRQTLFGVFGLRNKSVG
uniref:Protein dispatched 1 n=1 Tax=Ascaris suum TaxID=6253 RepID=F1L650_ASCSU